MISDPWEPMPPFLTATIRETGHPWPDGVDLLALLAFGLVAFGLPALGHWFMVIDVRGYLRSLRRALMVISHIKTYRQPRWVASDRPPCLDALDLTLPCSEEQVLAAYRKRVKRLHPDHGGNLQHFLRLQKHFEQALYLVRQQNSSRSNTKSRAAQPEPPRSTG